MSKRVSFAVMFQNNGDMAFGLIKYFLHDKDSGETYAVIDVPETTDAPDPLSKFSIHHIWLSKERCTFLLSACFVYGAWDSD